MSSSPSSSFDAAHVRERHSSSNSTSSRFPASSSSNLPPSSVSNPTTHPISLDAILSQHSSAPNPSLAALDQAISERNVFSSQNTQLWKLIEKQRSAYNHVLKELERMRAERDAYKARLQAAGISIELSKKDKDRPKALRPSASNATISSTLESGSIEHRGATVRNLPDTSGSHNDDRPTTPPHLQGSNNHDAQTVHSSSSFNTLPAIVPPRSVSLPQGSSSASSNPSPSSSILPSHPQPSVIPRTSGTFFQPQTQGAPPHSTSTSIHPPSPTPHSSAPDSSLLSTIPENAKPVKRNSNVSLPDEAKRYIANLTEGPQQNSQDTDVSDDALSKSGHTGSQDGEESEFLDMDEEDQAEEVAEQYQPSSVIHGHDQSADTDDFPMPPSFGHRPSHTQSASTQSRLNQELHLPPAAESAVASQTRWQSQSDISTLSQSQSSSESTPSTPQPDSPLPQSYLSSSKSMHSISGDSASANPTFRALPLLAEDLKNTRVVVSHSSIRPNDRGKEVLSFEIEVDPGKGKEPWKVEKLYSDVLGLDHRLRAVVGKSVSKKIASLPEGKLWRDHAPAKSDQRKAALEVYLQSLINLPVKNKDEVIAFLTSDIVRDAKKPVMQAGHKEGYLTKRGKNFGGWKTRYFVLQGPVLEYYESRGGTHLGSITITNAQIGRQQRTADHDDEKNYRHAFLIIEAKKGPGGSNPRHVLCAESDSERDSWVDILVRYVTGAFNDDSFTSVSTGPSPIAVHVPQTQSPASGQPRSSVSSNQDTVTTPNGKRGIKGTLMPISQLSQDANNPRLFQSASFPGCTSLDESHSSSPTKSVNTDRDQFTHDEHAKRLVERTDPPLSSSLPTSSPLETAGQNLVAIRSSSELGHYTDIDRRGMNLKQEQIVPESGRSRELRRDRKSYHRNLATVSGSPTTATFSDRACSPDPGMLPLRGGEQNGKVKISGPLNGVPIPAGYKFGSKDAPTEGTSSSDRREKAKSRSFWNFGRPADKFPATAPRAVFGVPLDESLDVTEIARLPAVVFRCIQYLEAKKAEQEEGIYRLSGSSAVIKGLKDRFNAEGDVDLLASDEYWDPHAIAGLLKSFLRELPASILTRDLHMRFLSVMDFVEPQERIRELSQLIATLPIANYSLLRALTAHLILIVQNSTINKMTMRNVGIVFSPTLGIPAGVFSLMLGEFNRVFNVDAASDVMEDADQDGELSRRNSQQYSDAAADKLLGLEGRTLHAATEETPSEESDGLSIQYESGNETTEIDATAESSQTHSSNPSHYSELLAPPTEFSATDPRSHAAHVATSRGLNIAITKKSNRQSRMMGLPVSPRPTTDAVISPSSPLQTAKQS
ncbi:hypothetical protein JVU11DRAFT_6387 [Chiua virens]|nr:hypothetical protein JVU11DRAFT_6387 [Chiua virens]